MKLKIVNVVGARPNFMKMAPLVEEMKRHAEIESLLVHTGQHYDPAMSKLFFDDLDLPEPDIHLGVGSGSHGTQTGKIMIEFETTEREARRNLEREGIDTAKIFFAGNVMIDTLVKHRKRAERSRILGELNVESRRYGLVTLHRPSNADSPENLSRILAALIELQRDLPLVFPVHPRKRKQLQQFGLDERVQRAANLKLTTPLGYLDFLKLMAHARLVLTDSGGIQEETTALGVPCLTMRENTERPITVEAGTNIVIGDSPGRILEESRRILSGHGKKGTLPELWDGHAAERIVRILLEKEARREDRNKMPSAIVLEAQRILHGRSLHLAKSIFFV